MKILQGVIDVKSVEDLLKAIGDCAVLIDADYIVDLGVVEFAVEKAVKSWKNRKNIAKTLPMEILLYVSATRQIRDAVKLGVKEGKNKVVVVVLKDECIDKLKELGFEECEVLKTDEEKVKRIKEFYSIGDEELNVVGVEKLPLLIRERIALFDVFKESF
jgi:KEOPS complex subunit Cgi121